LGGQQRVEGPRGSRAREQPKDYRSSVPKRLNEQHLKEA